ncbi:MAG: T9SS type A sorting domain-containing protein [Bacteroidetes bacterium]|nr:T9SS type A sorting domain-containing protein [Bacteroidota bacterium]
MKKLLFLIAFVSLSTFINAQLSLTSAAFKPIIGDVYQTKEYDTVSFTVDQTIGTNKFWNFSSFYINGPIHYQNITFTTAASGLNSSAFPGASLASFDALNTNEYKYYKTNGANFEFMGMADNVPSSVSFVNNSIDAVYPISYGNSYGDTYSGVGTYSSSSASYAGTLNLVASGTGTVVIPGNVTFTNCLQVITTRTLITNVQSVFTATVMIKEINYYHSSQKFPIISFLYQTGNSSFGPANDFHLLLNKSSLVGLKENSGNSYITIYPNPVAGKLKLILDNKNLNDLLNITITDLTGKIVKEEKLNYGLNTEIDVHKLTSGFYILNINSKGINYNKKFVKE